MAAGIDERLSQVICQNYSMVASMDKTVMLADLLDFQAEGRKIDNIVSESWTPDCKALIQDWHKRLSEYLRANMPAGKEEPLLLKTFGMKGLFIAPWQQQADQKNVTMLLKALESLIEASQ